MSRDLFAWYKQQILFEAARLAGGYNENYLDYQQPTEGSLGILAADRHKLSFLERMAINMYRRRRLGK